MAMQFKKFNATIALPIYPPSNEIKRAHEADFANVYLNSINSTFSDYLKSTQLSSHNICAVLNTLLQIEDVTILHKYVPFVQKNVVLQKNLNGDYQVRLPNVSDILNVVNPTTDEMMVLRKSDSQFAIDGLLNYKIDLLQLELIPYANSGVSSECYRATITDTSNDTITFKCNIRSKRSYFDTSTTSYNIIFRPSRVPLRCQYYALELLAQQPEMHHHIFPKANQLMITQLQRWQSINLDLVNKEIKSNREQYDAVQYIAAGKCNYLQPPYIIYGPPGTGKTTTIVEAIIQLLIHQPNSRILVTAGSNSACDTIALRLCKHLHPRPKTRCAPCISFPRFILHLIIYVLISLFLYLFNEFTKKDSNKVLRLYSKSIGQNGKLNNIDEDLINISNYQSGKFYSPSMHEIRSHSIVVATLSTVGRLVTGNNCIGDKFFTHVFIDEAAASTEAEALVGIMGIASPNTCRIILSGDHKQLGPVLQSQLAAQLGLRRSLMERLLENEIYSLDDKGNYDRTVQSRLYRNYRSHPEIVRLYNTLYYNNELLALAEKENVNQYTQWSYLKNSKFPILFQEVYGKAERDRDSKSSYNNLEVEALMWYLKQLLVIGIDGKKVEQTDIGIITPYSKQCLAIEKKLTQNSWSAVEIGSVETFQGREKPIIIVSLVRSGASLGFVADPRRLNVILSRAKSLLILIGNPRTLSKNADLRFIINECKKQGTMRRPLNL